MPLARRLVPIAAAALTGAVAVGFAATMGVDGSGLGAGGAAVDRCDTGGVTVAYVGAPGDVTAVQVAGLAAACAGGAARVAVDDGAGGSLATGSATVSGSSLTIPVSPARPAAQVARWRLVVVTP